MNGIKEMNSMLMLKTWSLRSTLRLKTFQYKIHSRLPRARSTITTIAALFIFIYSLYLV